MSKIIQLDDREHVLKRPARYIGSVVPVTQNRPMLENGKIVFKDIEYVPALIKIIREIIDNSIEHAVETNFEYANKIDITIGDKHITVSDNGKGIPVKSIHDSKGNEIDILGPEAVWTQLKTGSAFDDAENNKMISQNGEGSTLTNIFSKRFVGTTDDGKKHFILDCTDNMGTIKKDIKKSTGKTFTKVAFWPDLERLHLGDKIDQLYSDLIEFELLFIAATYPKIDIKFNGKKIEIKSFRQLYMHYFEDDIEMTETDNVFVAISKSDIGYKFIHFINGINVFNGGSIIDYANKTVVSALTDMIAARKISSIKRSDVNNKIMLHVHIKNMPLPRFADQIKSEAVNTPSQIPEIAAQIREIAKARFIERVYKNKSITTPIIDQHKANMLIQEKNKLKTKIKRSKKSAKYWPATKDKKYFVIAEGDSAIGSIIDGLGRDLYGFFPIKGKSSNVIKNPKAIQTDNELLEIIKIMDLLNDDNNYTYESIVIASDADVDGKHVTSLLVAFINTTAPELLRTGKVYQFMTPIIVAYKRDKIDKFLFTFDEYNEYKKNNDKGVYYDYKKGLGSLEEDEWVYLFDNYEFEDLLVPLTVADDEDIDALIAWMDDDREYRKTAVREGLKSFNFDKV